MKCIYRYSGICILFLFTLLSAACSTNLYQGNDASTVSITGYLESIDGKQIRKSNGSYKLSPGDHFFGINHGWPDLNTKLLFLNMEPSKKYYLKSFSLRRIDGTLVKQGWNIFEKGAKEKPFYAWCLQAESDCGPNEKTPRTLAGQQVLLECLKQECIKSSKEADKKRP